MSPDHPSLASLYMHTYTADIHVTPLLLYILATSLIGIHNSPSEPLEVQIHVLESSTWTNFQGQWSIKKQKSKDVCTSLYTVQTGLAWYM